MMMMLHHILHLSTEIQRKAIPNVTAKLEISVCRLNKEGRAVSRGFAHLYRILCMQEKKTVAFIIWGLVKERIMNRQLEKR